ncbi:metallophosphoesterase family protein [Anaerocolumna sp. AGMB13025]|uniref:metallophosphoesterase family protein n=1 Tax=Anaerocolumna sp. AGMB13025 TaxID=3039116 RepID=UPI00241D999D|nr:metallophosphoesterase family protein [Anaerocolumna sp. AGMB13025]WFR56010.1 metallophosphoesterase family protein [Anaerocolumna sp. AGMB13025]
MDIAIMSDIHSNYVALERCLDYTHIHGIDTFIFLGDYIGELAYPERTMKILYELDEKYNCYFIKGNKEEYWLNSRAGGEKAWKYKDSTTGALLYAYNLLSDKDISFFAKLQSAAELSAGELPAITMCHGSPYQVSEKMLPGDDRTIKIMDRVKTPIILCGHTHVQSKFVYNGKCVLNPGSVGMPMLSKGMTQFLILHGKNGIWSEEFISLSYDIDRVIKELHEAKLDEYAPYWSMISEYTLLNGNTSHGTILSRAMELCRKETGDCIWPDIPETYWAQAVNECLF